MKREKKRQILFLTEKKEKKYMLYKGKIKEEKTLKCWFRENKGGIIKNFVVITGSFYQGKLKMRKDEKMSRLT